MTSDREKQRITALEFQVTKLSSIIERMVNQLKYDLDYPVVSNICNQCGNNLECDFKCQKFDCPSGR